MERRTFLFRASAAAAATACSAASWAQDAPGATAELTVAEGPFAAPLPLTYNGLSYELSQLTDPQFFNAANRDLVAHFRLLSPNGVLRVGGNTSEFCWFQADDGTQAPKLRVPPGKLEDNWMPHRLFAIKPEAIDALAGFPEGDGMEADLRPEFRQQHSREGCARGGLCGPRCGRAVGVFPDRQ